MRPILLRQLARSDPAEERRKAPRSYIYQNIGCKIFPDSPGSIHGERKIYAMVRDFSSTGFGFRDFFGDMVGELRIGRRYVVQVSLWYHGSEVDRLYFYARFVHRSIGAVAPERPGPRFERKLGVLGFEIEQYPLGDEDLSSRLV